MGRIKKIEAIHNTTVFLIRNIMYGFKLQEFEKADFDNFEVEPLKRKNLKKVLELYKEFCEGKSLTMERYLLLRFAGSKYCYILRSKEGEVFGMGIFYFNKRDLKERTIHEGYIGLKIEYRGIGIGTLARQYAIKHFAKTGYLKGISSRISLDNVASLKGNMKLGFEIKEKYWDKEENKERAYLECDLSQYR